MKLACALTSVSCCAIVTQAQNLDFAASKHEDMQHGDVQHGDTYH